MMDRRGFSLFELLLVLAILVVVVSIVSVDISNIFTNNNISVVSKEIVTDLNYAQQKAIEEGNNWIVEFNEVGYEVFSSSNPTDVVINKEFSDKKVYFGDHNGDNNPTNSSVEFEPSGGLALNSVEVIGLHNQNDSFIYIVINSSTGRVTIQDVASE